MRVIARRTLREFWESHADAEGPLRAWLQDAEHAVWRSPHDIKATYANASIVNNERIVFNIKGNSYRLIVAISFVLQIAFVKFIGTHAEYDRVDASSVNGK